MSIKYKFKDLKEIAAFFRATGNDAKKRADYAKTQKDRALHVREWSTWHLAADVLEKAVLGEKGEKL